MCGIYFSISLYEQLSSDEDTLRKISRRGPDSYLAISETFVSEFSNTSIHLKFAASVLSLRGRSTCNQPATSEMLNHIFCWNGEAWKFEGQPVRKNDTSALSVKLARALQASEWKILNHRQKKERIAGLVLAIDGPFSFILYDKVSALIFFGRDPIGRRSLLVHRPDENSLVISSVPGSECRSVYKEVEHNGLHVLNVERIRQKCKVSDMSAVEFDEWEDLVGWPGRAYCQSNKFLLKLNTETDATPETTEEVQSNTLECYQMLIKSLQMRVASIPDLPRSSTEPVDEFGTISPTIKPEKVAILFSGGLDCSILARLSHDLVPIREPIILINVAFENPKLLTKFLSTGGDTVQGHDPYEACPDRITARRSLRELKETCPGRIWKFLVVNIAYAETRSHINHVRCLMQPNNTEMDLSIAMALYFASRGKGSLEENGTSVEYVTSARVFISGLGADELFGGYIRHETAMRRDGIRALIAEMQLDIQRIGTRNLGRDDRMIANWAKEIRYPYLDDDFVQWSLQLPVRIKCALSTLGKVDVSANAVLSNLSKSLLRHVALRIGLRCAARERKRAIQFGSRSAKMLNHKARGTDVL